MLSGLEIFEDIPDKNISHCSRKLSVNSAFGCSSKYPSSTAEVLISENTENLYKSLKESASLRIVVIPLSIFVNKDAVSFLKSSEKIAGLFVFSPNFPTSNNFDPLPFSENTACPNGNFTFYNNTQRQCNVIPSWNPPATEYGFTSWPFPVVLADGNCFNTYNVKPIDDTRCFMEIRNYMSAVNSTQTCYNREVLLSYRLDVMLQFILNPPPTFCNQIGGMNTVLRARAVTKSPQAEENDPTVLVLSRVDALSMFDRRATSGLSVLPAVSVLISAAVHLLNQPDVKAGRLRKNLLFALLDNEALSFMGSQRFLFDLSQGHIAQASGSPIKSIESVIELTGVGLPKYEDKSIYYLLSDIEIAKQVSSIFLLLQCKQFYHFQTENVTSAIWKSLNDSAASQGGQVVLLNGSVPGPEPMLLPPSVSTQALLTYYDMQGVPLSHTVISDRPGRSPYADEWIDSFLDKKWPPTPEAGEHLLQLANVLADALHRLITKDSKPIPQPISGLKPAELMHCFLHNPGCELLRLTYEPVDGHGWRVSHIAARLLMGLTGERLKECPPSKDYGSYTYLYGCESLILCRSLRNSLDYNGTNWCYKSLMETSTSFFFLEGGAVASPGWVRSALYENKRYVRLFRSSSPHEDGVSLALGILLTALIGSVAYVLRRFSAHIFVKPYDVIPDNQVVLPVNVM
ncbi:unnamed protein product [Mesocestoides corti]|uniref:Nicastrin n=1 Tax=Mesocestoides corti TaxID=53468 RepID=A0A0R3UEZ8_MESCO|nr:unnamed protein product [Mesocestoides corti]